MPQTALERIERGATISVRGRTGAERAADPFLSRARNHGNLFRALTTLLLAQFVEKNFLEFCDSDDLSDQDEQPNLLRTAYRTSLFKPL
jgi:hypothetical protein